MKKLCNNKKAFTLIELLAVISLIGIISLIAMPKILEQYEKKKDDVSELSKEMLYTGAEEYILKNTQLFDEGVGYLCVSLQTLVDNGNLIEPIIDVKTGTTIPLTKKVEVTYDNKQYEFEYDTSRCQ